ncbi:MAG: hypothetical protein ACOC32_02410 [Nanoarchaeota archaeon]
MNFNDLMRSLANLGVWDIVLPFMLVFTIVYATLTSVLKNMFGKKDENTDNRKFAVIIAMVIAFGVVIPHAIDAYPPGMNVVEIINSALPQVAMIAVAVIGVMILLGLFGINTSMFNAGGISTFIVVAAIGIIIYIFGSAAGWGWQIPRQLNFLNDPDTQALLIAILVFGLIVRWIVGPSKPKKGVVESLGKLQEALFGSGGGSGNGGGNN